MYLALQTGNFTCPSCERIVTEAMVTEVNTIFTAPANGAHAGVGHTVALAGSGWLVRCGDSRSLSVHRSLRVEGKRLMDSTAAGSAPPQGPPDGSPGGKSTRPR